jgi:hypothetical protein
MLAQTGEYHLTRQTLYTYTAVGLELTLLLR